MGNITKAQREKNEQLKEEKLTEMKLKTAEKLHALKMAILSIINDYWKSEWKDAVSELTMQMEIGIRQRSKWSPPISSRGYRFNLDNDLREVTFRNVPGLICRPYCESKWIIPQYSSSTNALSSALSSAPEHKTGVSERTRSASTRVRNILGLEDKLPYNLWVEVLHAFYSFFHTSAQSAHDISDEKTLSNLLLETQVYILPQHYSPTIFYNVPCDRGWIRFGDAHNAKNGEVSKFGLQNFETGHNRQWNKTFVDRVMDVVAKHQAGKLIDILFRHNSLKRDFAKQLLEFTTCVVDEKSVKVFTKTIRPKAYWEDLDTWNRLCNSNHFIKSDNSTEKIRHRAAMISSLFPFSLGSSRRPASFAEEKRRELAETRAKELSLFDQFDAHELESLFSCIMQIFIEYDRILRSDSKSGNDNDNGKSEPHLRSSFPSSDDHFNNLDNLRGRLAGAPIIKELELFHSRIAVTELKLQEVFFPNVLIRLITDYFPPPSPAPLETSPEESCAWLPPASRLSSWS